MIRALLFFLLTPAAGFAASCENVEWESDRYTICRVSPANEELRLFLYDEDGAPFGHFGNIDQTLEAEGLRLDFAMNAGMYHDDRAPVGYYVEDGQEIMQVVPSCLLYTSDAADEG